MSLIKDLAKEIIKLQERLRRKDKRLTEMLTIKNLDGKGEFEITWEQKFYEKYHGPLYKAMEEYKDLLERECKRFKV
mgnify:CR=1 FL=1